MTKYRIPKGTSYWLIYRPHPKSGQSFGSKVSEREVTFNQNEVTIDDENELGFTLPSNDRDAIEMIVFREDVRVYKQ